jgi:hypothetical protein
MKYAFFIPISGAEVALKKVGKGDWSSGQVVPMFCVERKAILAPGLK